MSFDNACVFSLDTSKDFGASVSLHLGSSLSGYEEKEFEDGEYKIRPLVSIQGKDIFVIQSLYADRNQSINDKLCRLLFFVSTLKDAGAARVTAIIPYLCFSRQDRCTQVGEPVTTRYVAILLEAAGVSHVVTLEAHNLVAYQNAFRCLASHLDAGKLFAEYFSPLVKGQETVVLSPDIGGINRMEKFRVLLSDISQQTLSGGFMEKYRTQECLSGQKLFAEVEGRTVILFDDLISTGKTIARAAAACRAAGARRIYAAASHGLFAGEARKILDAENIEKIVVTNTVPPLGLDIRFARERVTALDVSKLFADSIERIHFHR